MRTAHHHSRGPLVHMPPAWMIAVGVITIGAANLALIVTVAAGRFG
jgi:hypothetical protein